MESDIIIQTGLLPSEGENMKGRVYRYTKMVFRLVVKAIGAVFGLIVCGLLVLLGSRKGCNDLDELIEIFNEVSAVVEAMVVRIPTALIFLLAYICAFIDDLIISPIAKLVNLVLFPIRHMLFKRVATDDVKNTKNEQAKTRIAIVKNKVENILSRMIYVIIYWNVEVILELLDENDAKESASLNPQEEKEVQGKEEKEVE